MDSSIINTHQGVSMIKDEPECQCDGVKCEVEIVEGISSNQNLNDSLLGQKVKIGQPKAVCKQEPVEVKNTATDDIFSIIDGLAQGREIKREDEESCEPEEIFTMGDKPDDLNVNRELDGKSSLMLSSSLHRPCFVNMCDNNVLYTSQQHPGEMKKNRHRKKRNPRKSKMSLALPYLKSHRRCGSRLHQCNTCNYSAPHLSYLVRHKRTHTGEKPYRCDKCPYAAARACHLVQHKRRHTGEKPYRCDKCPYAAAQAGHLVEHKRTHTGEKPYRCDKCPYTAARGDALVEHKRKHTGEKPYRCDKCPYAAGQANRLVRHKRTHAGE